MEQALLIRYGEIHLKGQNRPFFERTLVQNIQKAALAVAPCKLVRDQGRFLLVDYDRQSAVALMAAVNRVFGVHSVSPATVCEPTMEAWQSLS